jgi:threonyl-tRNA synthetase
VIATIVSDANPYAEEAAARMRAAGIRVELDLRNEKIGYRVREHTLSKAPLLFAIGRREAEAGAVAMRRLGTGSDAQENLALTDAIARVVNEAAIPQA